MTGLLTESHESTAGLPDRPSDSESAFTETFGQQPWLGQETGQNKAIIHKQNQVCRVDADLNLPFDVFQEVIAINDRRCPPYRPTRSSDPLLAPNR